jgi:putative lipoic acid-binding regulatory protein
MAVEVKDTTFDEYLEFPCSFNFKVLGIAHEDLVTHVVSTLQKHAQSNDYSPTVKPSSKGTYHSVTVTVTVTSKSHIELLYTELGKLELVRYVM